ncbi:MAG: LysE family translocator [Pseudomonadota bacterium]
MEWFIPLAGFILISTITPGPNNLLLAASGINFGVRRTLPHVVGIHLGVYSLVVLCGLGLGQVLLALPDVLIGLKVFASVYLLYLAWQIIGFRFREDAAQAEPMRILQAGLFQVSNPKAWMMATTGLNFSLAIADDMSIAVIALCLGFATLGTLCNLSWVWLGASLQTAMRQPHLQRLINGVLAAITLATVVMFWMI